jgi:Transaldolase/Fructose-6-phosphate aldolase
MPVPSGKEDCANRATIDLLVARSETPRSERAVATGTPDVLYVSELVGPDVVNTMPEKTLHAFADHGEATRTVDAHGSAAEDVLAAARDAGVDLDRITAELEREGVRSFCDSYHQLLGCLESKLRQVAHDNLDAERWLDEGGSPAATR